MTHDVVMFAKKTLVVLGAGAAHEVGFPLGLELRDRIRELADSTFITRRDDDRERKVRLALEHGDYEEEAFKLRDGLSGVKSIDDFIDMHSSDTRLARLAKVLIAAILLEAEQGCDISEDAEIFSFDKPSTVDGSCYNELWHILKDGVRKETVDGLFADVRIVSFNYERSLEWFLFNRIRNTFQISDRQALDVLGTLQILRPYGGLGSLDTQHADRVPFAGGFSGHTVARCAEKIRTFSEGVADEELSAAVSHAVNESEIVVMLGLGFHETNLRLLRRTRANVRRKVYATAYGFSEPNTTEIENRIGRLFVRESYDAHKNAPEHPRFREMFVEDMTCQKLLAHYQLPLSASRL